MIPNERYSRLYSYFSENQEQILKDLAYLCSMPSVRSKSDDENEPFGHECALCLEKTAELFRENGFETDVYAKSGYALSFGANVDSEKTIGIYAHSDVVPVNEAEWTVTKPFEPKIVGNCIFARGIKDNKDAVVASLYIMKALRELGIQTNSKFQIFIGSNEESGMADVKKFVVEQKLPDVNIVPDAGYPAAIGQKGILRFDVRSKKPFEDIVNVSGGTAYNILLDKVSAKIKNKEGMLSEMLQRKPNNIEIEDGNFITVTAKGVSAHASRAELGVNALGILVNFLLEIEALSKSDKEILRFVSHSLSDVYGKAWGIDSYNDFFKETTCSNGIARMVDSCLEYTFDVRHNDVIPPEELVSRIEKYFSDGGFTYKKYSHSVCMKRDENSMPIKTFMEGYRELTGNHESKSYVMGGGTYANYLDGGFAIGVDYWSFKPDADVPEGHGGVHQADEVLCIPNFIDGMALMAELILQIDEKSTDSVNISRIFG